MSVAVVDFREVTATFKRMEAKLGAPLVFTKALADVFAIQARDTFRAQGSPYGARWRPLKTPRRVDVLAAKKKVRNGLTPRGGLILQKSGALRKSLKFRLLSDKTFALEATVPYAAAQNYGSKARNLPARPFLPNSTQGVPPTWMDAANRRLNGPVLVELRSLLLGS